MQIFKTKSHIDFLGKRNIALGFSLILIVLSITSLATRGLNLGIDFTGGYLIEVGYSQPVDLVPVRKTLAASDYSDAMVQHFGTSRDILVRIAPREGINSAHISDEVLRILKNDSASELEMRRIEFVGPQVGDELREQGGMALLIALFGILIYVGLRFQLKSAFGAILALAHDVIITVGVFSVTQMPFDLTVLAAILAVIGYSLNDTVVVLDRIRETFRAQRKGSATEILNLSINDTLSRTIITSLTTLLVLIALFTIGGEVIHGFSFALIVGVFIGTYSSIYVAGNSLMMMNVTKQDFLESAKENEELDDLP
ncbi:Protein translocase subunit SecF [hydrothermal vent metagenome]|uniref:Protein translocase subunit SecF n=1 Tax=hydrothermal vent metagenome TaxID=652676 RepID=A0A3B0YH12_9ZZZZ